VTDEEVRGVIALLELDSGEPESRRLAEGAVAIAQVQRVVCRRVLPADEVAAAVAVDVHRDRTDGDGLAARNAKLVANSGEVEACGFRVASTAHCGVKRVARGSAVRAGDEAVRASVAIEVQRQVAGALVSRRSEVAVSVGPERIVLGEVAESDAH